MQSKHKNILFFLAVLSTIGVFMFGMVMWPHFKEVGTNRITKSLYYVTTSFTMYMLSFVLMLFSKTYWMKVASSLLLAMFGVNIYIELYLDPAHWTSWDFWAILIFAANMILSFTIIEKIKVKNEQ